MHLVLERTSSNIISAEPYSPVNFVFCPGVGGYTIHCEIGT